MYCMYCGNKNNDGAAFCSSCGAALAEKKQPRETASAPAVQNYAEDRQQETYQQETYQQETYQQETYQQETYPQNNYPQETYPQNNYNQQYYADNQYGYQNNYYYDVPTEEPPKVKGKGLGIASFVLSLVGLFFFDGYLVSFIALLLGRSARKKAKKSGGKTGFGTAGYIISLITMLPVFFCIIALVIFVAFGLIAGGGIDGVLYYIEELVEGIVYAIESLMYNFF